MDSEEDDEWTVLSMDNDTLSEEVLNSPNKNDSVDEYHKTSNCTQNIPLINHDTSEQNNDESASRTRKGQSIDLAKDTTSSRSLENIVTISRRNTQTKTSKDTMSTIKENSIPQRSNWYFSPRNVAMIVSIGCFGFIAFMSLK
tara:strand:- start:274 stop:702 length:429 start_codon:yes stop_codon:yes gene_type:complete